MKLEKLMMNIYNKSVNECVNEWIKEGKSIGCEE